MSKELEIKGDRARQIINNLTIRPEELKDYSKVSLVNNLAFKQENEAQLIDKIRQSDRYIPELSLVAVLDENIIGHIMFSYIDLIAEEVTQVLALAPVTVLPEYQNKGIGSLLIQTGLEIADKISAPMIIVLGDAKFYARFRFKPAIDYGIQSLFDVPNEYFMVKFLAQDSKNYRGKIRYPLAFNNV